MSQHKSIATVCPGCGSPRSSLQLRCWLCGDASTAKDASAGALRGESRSLATFGLDTLLLTVTLVAVCLGLGAFSPSLGILLAIVAGPAYIRSLVVVARRKNAGGRAGFGGKIEVFFVSLAVMSVVVVASIIAFVATCFPLGLLGFGMADKVGGSGGGALVIGAFFAGFAVAGVVAWLLLRWAKNLG